MIMLSYYCDETSDIKLKGDFYFSMKVQKFESIILGYADDGPVADRTWQQTHVTEWVREEYSH